MPDAAAKPPRKERPPTGNPSPVEGKCNAINQFGLYCGNVAGAGTDHKGQGKCKFHGGATPRTHGRYSVVTSEPLRKLIEHFEAQEDPLDLTPEVAMLRALVTDFVNRYQQYSEALIAWHASFGPQYLQELDLYRRRYEKWREKLDDYYDALDHWRAAFEEAAEAGGESPERPDLPVLPDPPEPPQPADFGGKPRQVTDVVSASKFLADVGHLAEKIHKQRQEGTISLETLDQVLQTFGVEATRAVASAIPDDESLRAAVLRAIEERWAGVTLPVAAVRGAARPG